MRKATKITIEKSKFGSFQAGTFFVRGVRPDESWLIAVFFTKEYAQKFADIVGNSDGAPVEWVE